MLGRVRGLGSCVIDGGFGTKRTLTPVLGVQELGFTCSCGGGLRYILGSTV